MDRARTAYPLIPDLVRGVRTAISAASGSPLRRGAAVSLSMLIWLGGATIAAAQPENANAEISSRRAAERTAFSDDEIKDGFLKIALGAELQFDGSDKRIRKFDGPVRVFVVNRAGSDRHADISKVVADIQARVDHLDLAITDDRQAANVVVTMVRRNDFASTIRSRFGADKARQIQQTLHPQCLSGIGVDKQFRIQRAEVILPVDSGEFTLYDCAYEELLQVLGVVNDDRSVPWTMFNDDVQMGFFDVYDQHLVNLLYDPRVQPGMTRAEVNSLIPEVLPDVRKWVQSTNPDKPVKSSESAEKGFDTVCNCDGTNRREAAILR
jgi:hypothetical protein